MDRTEHKNLRLPQYIDPADIMEINRNFNDIDVWANQTDLALENRAFSPQLLPTEINLNNLILSGTYYRTGGSAASIINMPVGGYLSFSLTVEKTGRGSIGVIQTYKNADGSGTFVRYAVDDWTEWNSTPARKIDISGILPSGVTKRWGYYAKDNTGRTTLLISVTTSSVLSSTPQVIATMPMGYRPYMGWSTTGFAEGTVSGQSFANLLIDPDNGQVKASILPNSPTTLNIVIASIIFDT